jgi:hypothetical protein
LRKKLELALVIAMNGLGDIRGNNLAIVPCLRKIPIRELARSEGVHVCRAAYIAKSATVLECCGADGNDVPAAVQ